MLSAMNTGDTFLRGSMDQAPKNILLYNILIARAPSYPVKHVLRGRGPNEGKAGSQQIR